MNPPALRLGMIGGGRDAFIGGVHRMASRLDGAFTLAAGALSSSPEKAVASGRDLGLPDDRNYPSWRAMLEGELARQGDDRVDAVSIVTPNHTHFEIAHAFIDAGFNVILDKPMVNTLEEATELEALIRSKDVVFAVTYNYSGYPLVRHARDLVAAGELGSIRKVIVEYCQGWLADQRESTGQKQADWRTDPARAGFGGAIGDIGSHAEQLTSFVTGLEIESVCAELTSFVPGRRLDDDATVLLRFTNGARGVLTASQVCIGAENALTLRVWGDRGGLSWRQERPNELTVCSHDGTERVLRRGAERLSPAASAATRIPPGHPEAFIEAFANVYVGVAHSINARLGRVEADPRLMHPTVIDGVRGVRFIHRVVESAGNGSVWTPMM